MIFTVMKLTKAAHRMKKRRLTMIHHATIPNSFARNLIWESYEKLRLDWHIKRTPWWDYLIFFDKILVYCYESMDQPEIGQ
jgi:hypothetical protein